MSGDGQGGVDDGQLRLRNSSYLALFRICYVAGNFLTDLDRLRYVSV